MRSTYYKFYGHLTTLAISLTESFEIATTCHWLRLSHQLNMTEAYTGCDLSPSWREARNECDRETPAVLAKQILTKTPALLSS
jgi:hypothetical protein